MGSKLPFFKFWAFDWSTDQQIKMMSYRNRGIFVSLLVDLWISGGIPSDTKGLLKVCPGIKRKSWEKTVWPVLKDFFIENINRPGYLTNTKMEEVRMEAETVSKKRQGAVNRRWLKEYKCKDNQNQMTQNHTREREESAPPTPAERQETYMSESPQIGRLQKRFGFGKRRATELAFEHKYTASDLDAWEVFAKTHKPLEVAARIQAFKNPSEVPPDVNPAKPGGDFGRTSEFNDPNKWKGHPGA